MRQGWPRWLECRPTWHGRTSRPATARHAASSSSNGWLSCNSVATTSDANAAFGTLRTVGVDFLVTLGDHGPSFDPSGSARRFQPRVRRSIRSVRARPARRCLVCGSDRWEVLPEVGPQSMASDWRVLPAPLRKRVCPECGLVASAAPPPRGLFEDGYALYAHAPSAAPRERRRQQLYARWIVHARERAGQSAPPQSVSMLAAETHRFCSRSASTGRRRRCSAATPRPRRWHTPTPQAAGSGRAPPRASRPTSRRISSSASTSSSMRTIRWRFCGT